MTERNFRSALREADRAFENQGMPPEVDARLRHRFRAPELERTPAPVTPWLWRGALVAAAAAVAIVLVVRFTGDEGDAIRMLGRLRVLARSPDLSATVSTDGTIVIRRGHCTLATTDGTGSVRVLTPASLRPVPRGLRVMRGEVHVRVARRPPGRAPLRVLVSHGAIEVMGTRFIVDQREHGGQVLLEEGAIRFVSEDGRVRVLAPGQSLSWPLPPERADPTPPAPTPDPTPDPRPAPHRVPRRPRKSVPEPRRLARLLEQVAELRTRARYDRAARILRSALQRRWSADNRERLSFELGSILTYHLRDRRGACRWWSQHRRRYPGGSYADEVAQAEAQARCATAEEDEP